MPKYYPIVDPRLNYNNFIDKLLGSSELYSQLRIRYYWYKLNYGPEGMIPPSAYANEYSPWSVKQYKITIQSFVDLSRNVGATPILLPQASLVHPSNTREERKRIGFQYPKLTHDALVKAYQDCNRIIKTVSEEKDVKLIDHVHLTAEGGQRVAHIVAKFFADELRSVRD